MTAHLSRFACPVLVTLGMTVLSACSATSTATRASLHGVDVRPAAHALESLPREPVGGDAATAQRRPVGRFGLAATSAMASEPRLVHVPRNVRAVRECWRCSR